MSESRTETGRHRHHYRSTWGGTCRCGEYEPYSEEWEAGRERVAIEAEARADALRDAAAAVEGLPTVGGYPNGRTRMVCVGRRAALDAIRALGEKENA